MEEETTRMVKLQSGVSDDVTSSDSAYKQRHSHVSIQGSGRHHKIPVNPTPPQTSVLCPKTCCTYTELQRQTLPPRGPTIMTSKHILLAAFFSCLMSIMTVTVAKFDTDKALEQKVRYDNLADCMVTSADTKATLPKICKVDIDIAQDMNAPVYVYYSFTNFYQNHRRYLKSKSAAQLRAEFPNDELNVNDCEPEITKRYKNKPMYPCGLLAYTFPPDRFTASLGGIPLCPACNITLDAVNRSMIWENADTWAKDDIAWKTDVSEKFKYIETDGLTRSGPRWNDIYGIDLPRVDDKDFIVWMRSAPLPNFKKLYRVIKTKSLKKGDRLTFTVANFWDNQRYNTEKWISINTMGNLGGDNKSLIEISAVTASFSVVTIVIVFVMRSTKRKTFQDYYD